MKPAGQGFNPCHGGRDGTGPSTDDFHHLPDASGTIEKPDSATFEVIEVEECVGNGVVKDPSMIARVGDPSQILSEHGVERLRDVCGLFFDAAHGRPLRWTVGLNPGRSF